MIALADDAETDPYKVARELCRAMGRPWPARLSAREVLTASLMRDERLADEPGHVETLVKGILLDLDEAGLTIVASGDVE